MTRPEPTSARGVGGWLGGPGAGPDARMPRGPTLGLPAVGPGSAAGTGRKLLGLLADLFAALLIGRAVILLQHHPGVNVVSGSQTLAFVLEVWLLQASTGQSIGQRVTSTRIASVRGDRPSPWWLLLRTVLLVIPPFVLALVTDRDGRGLHDRACGTVVLCT